MKASDLVGTQLDWSVAKCKGWTDFDEDYGAFTQHEIDGSGWLSLDCFNPSENWAQGGPIIDTLTGFQLKIWLESKFDSKCEALIHNYAGDWAEFGPTPLIAAMRCYVSSKLGGNVEIPESLK